jgi:pilus assembly protein Flp/PilA
VNRDEQGQGLVEYALIIALVSIALVIALGALGTQVGSTFSNITGTLAESGA